MGMSLELIWTKAEDSGPVFEFWSEPLWTTFATGTSKMHCLGKCIFSPAHTQPHPEQLHDFQPGYLIVDPHHMSEFPKVRPRVLDSPLKLRIS